MVLCPLVVLVSSGSKEGIPGGQGWGLECDVVLGMGGTHSGAQQPEKPETGALREAPQPAGVTEGSLRQPVW